MATIPAPSTMLADVELFRGLAPKQLRSVAASLKPMRFAAGQTVTEEGSDDSRFHLIVEGTAKVSVNGRTRATLGPGAYFGEIAVLDGQGRSATVTAETELSTLSAAPWTFKAFLRTHPDITLRLLEEMCRRLRSAQRLPVA